MSRKFPEVRSFGKSLSGMIDSVMKMCATVMEKSSSNQDRKEKPDLKSYSTDLYRDVELMDGGFVRHSLSMDCPYCRDVKSLKAKFIKHPYSTDCPFCHNVKTADAVAQAPSMKTERGMKYFQKED